MSTVAGYPRRGCARVEEDIFDLRRYKGPTLSSTHFVSNADVSYIPHVMKNVFIKRFPARYADVNDLAWLDRLIQDTEIGQLRWTGLRGQHHSSIALLAMEYFVVYVLEVQEERWVQADERASRRAPASLTGGREGARRGDRMSSSYIGYSEEDVTELLNAGKRAIDFINRSLGLPPLTRPQSAPRSHPIAPPPDPFPPPQSQPTHPPAKPVPKKKPLMSIGTGRLPMGTPNTEGTCWFNAMITVLFHSDGLRTALFPKLRNLFQEPLHRRLAAMLLHVMSVRDNTDDDVDMVNPMAVLAELYDKNRDGFMPSHILRRVGWSYQPYFCRVLSLLNSDCATLSIEDNTLFDVHYTHLIAMSSKVLQLDRTWSNLQSAMTSALQGRKAVEMDVFSLQVRWTDIIKTGLRQIPIPEIYNYGGETYKLDAMFMAQCRHSTCGITYKGQPVMHENQVSSVRHTSAPYVIGCPYEPADWKDNHVQKNHLCFLQEIRMGSNCGFSFRHRIDKCDVKKVESAAIMTVFVYVKIAKDEKGTLLPEEGFPSDLLDMVDKELKKTGTNFLRVKRRDVHDLVSGRKSI